MQIVNNANYDYVWLNDDGSFGGFLDHVGQPVDVGAGGGVTLTTPQSILNKTLGAGTVFSAVPTGLTKVAVGLSNVANTAPIDLPVSDLTQLALNVKQPLIVSGTTISASRNLTAADLGKRFLVDSSSAAVVLTVPTGVFTAGNLQSVFFKRSGANSVTFVASGTTMDNANGVVFSDGETVGLLNHPTASDRFELVGDSDGITAPSVVALTTHTLATTDLGKVLQQQGTTPLTLTIALTATSGIVWTPGNFFFLGSVNTGGITVTPASGVTIVNIGSKTVVQDDTPLVYQMSPTTNRWLVL